MVAAMIGEPDPLTDSLVAAQARFGRSIYSCLGAQAPRPQQEGLHRACTPGVSPLQRCLGCAATCSKLAGECGSGPLAVLQSRRAAGSWRDSSG